MEKANRYHTYWRKRESATRKVSISFQAKRWITGSDTLSYSLHGPFNQHF